MASTFALSIVIGVKDQASGGVKSITRGLKTDLRGAVGSAKGHLQGLGRGIATVGRAFWQFGRQAVGFVVQRLQDLARWAKWAAAAFVASMVLNTRAAAAFEDVMMDVEIQSGATAEQMAAIKASAFERDFSRLGKTATDVGGSYKRLAAEGYEVVQMQQMLQPILETSVALGVEEAETTKLMLNLMEQFNLEAGDMTHISDVLASALGETSFQGQELAETMKMAGVAGRMAGWNLEGTIAVTDRIIKVTGEASLAGRYYRQLMFSMMAPTKRMADEFARVGISLDEITEATKDPIALARLLTKAQERGINFARAYGSIAAVAAAALVDEADAIEQVRDALGKSGAAHDAAIKKSKTLGGLVRGLVALFKNLMAAVGEGFLPAAKLGAAALSDLISGLIESGKAKAFGETLGEAATALVKFVIALAKGDVVKRWFAFFQFGFAELWKLLTGAENRFKKWAVVLGQEVKKGILGALMAIAPMVDRLMADLLGEKAWAEAKAAARDWLEVAKEAVTAFGALLRPLADAIKAVGPHIAAVVKWLLEMIAKYPKVVLFAAAFILVADAIAPFIAALASGVEGLGGLLLAAGVALPEVVLIIGGVVAAVIGLVIEVLALAAAWEEVHKWAEKAFSWGKFVPTTKEMALGLISPLHDPLSLAAARVKREEEAAAEKPVARGERPTAQSPAATGYRLTARGPGVASPEITVPVNVYIGNEQLDARQRQVAIGVVREAVAGAR